MRGESFTDSANAIIPLGDGFGNEFVGRNTLQLESGAVDPEKCIGQRQADSLVAVEEGMVARQTVTYSPG